MVVSLSSYCQYPTVKVIGKDSVVLMTIKQGQDINQKFIDMNSDIQNLKDSLIIKNGDVINLSSEKNKLNTSLNTMTIKSFDLENENLKLKKSLQDQEDLFLSERRKWAGFMMLSFVITVILGVFK